VERSQLRAISAIKLIMADTVEQATAILAELGEEGAVFAGGTWIMRSPIRGECMRSAYIGLRQIAELDTVDVTRGSIRIGACVTHARLVAGLASIDQCRGLVAAAGSAANPSIRQLATVGGNLCTWSFAASDLVPALLALDATIELASPEGRRTMSLAAFLHQRKNLPPGTLLTGTMFERKPLRTGHARLPLRMAGDYPVAIVSIAAELVLGGKVEDIRVAVGSVESSPRRWHWLEQQLNGSLLEVERVAELAKAGANDFSGRESVEVPAWYRVQVLPTLVRRATLAVLSAMPKQG